MAVGVDPGLPGKGSTLEPADGRRRRAWDDALVSYDLAVWDGDHPLDDRRAGLVYDELYERYLESDDASSLRYHASWPMWQRLSRAIRTTAAAVSCGRLRRSSRRLRARSCTCPCPTAQRRKCSSTPLRPLASTDSSASIRRMSASDRDLLAHWAGRPREDAHGEEAGPIDHGLLAAGGDLPRHQIKIALGGIDGEGRVAGRQGSASARGSAWSVAPCARRNLSAS